LRDIWQLDAVKAYRSGESSPLFWYLQKLLCVENCL